MPVSQCFKVAVFATAALLACAVGVRQSKLTIID